MSPPKSFAPDKPGHILIIEDEQAIADTVLYALRTEGFAAEHHQLGYEGLDALRSGRFDLLILDVGLPDVNGFDLCRELRRESNLPVIFLTARGEEIDRIVGLEIGADDYLVKPFSPRELSARVRTVLRRTLADPPTTTADASSTGGPFHLDPRAQCVRYQGQVLALTRYEYLLLKTLLEEPGRVFSRGQLMRRVWTAPDHSLERTVDTHIKTLRAKLRAVHQGADPIVTHRGLGYSLAPAR